MFAHVGLHIAVHAGGVYRLRSYYSYVEWVVVCLLDGCLLLLLVPVVIMQ